MNTEDSMRVASSVRTEMLRLHEAIEQQERSIATLKQRISDLEQERNYWRGQTIPADTPATVAELRAELAAANKRIAQLESTLIDVQNYGQKRIAELEKLIPLVSEVMANHRDPQSGEYNECESSPCMWCDLTQKAIDAARAKEGK